MAILFLPTRLGICHAVLLPIWERRTGGDPAMRRFLASLRDEPAAHERRLDELVVAAAALRKSGREDPGAWAAWLAASACLKATIHVPERDWRAALEAAVAADTQVGATGS